MQDSLFSLELFDSGRTRLIAAYRDPDHGRFRRISQLLSVEETTQLVLFSEAIRLQRVVGTPGNAAVEVGASNLSHDPDSTHIRLTRSVAPLNEVQATTVDVETFLSTIEPVTCQVRERAQSSKHGQSLAEHLDGMRLPDSMTAASQSEEITSRLRDIAMILLVEQASRKGSDFGRLLRAKSRQAEAKAEVASVFEQIAQGFAPPAKAA